MRTSREGKQRIEDHETPRGNYSPYPYRDSKGVPTQGIGETLGVTMDSPPMSYTEAVAKFNIRLSRDFESALNRLLGDSPTTQKQFDSMVSLAYNIGISDPEEDAKLNRPPCAFNKSTVLRLHKAGKYQAAAAAFAMWNKITVNGKLVTLNGLTNRRADEARVYLDGSAINGEGNENDAIERGTRPSTENDKPLMQTRTVAGGTLAATAATVSVVAQITASVKGVATDSVAVVSEFGEPLMVFGIGGAIAAFGAVGWILYARFNDRQKGLR